MPSAAERLPACGILVVAPCGRIRFITGQATHCLKEYFGPRPNSRLLPPPLKKWAATAAASPLCRTHGRRRLVVSLIDRSRKGSKCLLVREIQTARSASLTPTEISVLHCVEMGQSNGQIGQLLHIAVPTVKKHVENIMDN